jgi:hypothetical protein
MSKCINYTSSSVRNELFSEETFFSLAHSLALASRSENLFAVETCNYERKLRSACGDVYLWACRFENLWIIKASRADDQLCYSGRRAGVGEAKLITEK